MEDQRHIRMRAPKVTASQTDTMLQFLEQHAEYLRPATREERQKYDQLWWRLSTLLNTDPSNVRKTPEQWKTVWRDLRYKVTGKCDDRRKNPKETTPFTPLEEHILKIIGLESREYKDASFDEIDLEENEGNEEEKNTEPSGGQLKFRRKRASRATHFQLDKIVDFMEKYPQFAKGRIPRQRSEKIWRRLASMLNSNDVHKSPIQWKNVWRDIKYNAIARSIKSPKSKPLQNIPANLIREQRVLAILETDFVVEEEGATLNDEDLTDDNKSNVELILGNEDPADIEYLDETYIEQNEFSSKINSSNEPHDTSPTADSSTPFSLDACITDEKLISALPSLKSQNVLDEDEVFLLSILPAIKRMSEDEKYEFRADVTNLIRVMRKKRQ